MMKTDWNVFPIAEYERRATDWDAIVTARGYPPFLRSDFLRAALREFGTGRELLAVYGPRPPAAMLILSYRRAAAWETFQRSQLPLGAFVHDGTLDVEEAMRQLLASLPGIAVIVSVTQQDPQFLPRPPDTAHLRSLDYIETARVVVTGPFDAYWATRGKNLRTNVKRQLAKLTQESASIRLDTIAEVADVAQAIADYGRLESSGWKVAGGTAVAADNAQGRFYSRMFESFCDAGKTRIYGLTINGRLAAMDLCIEDDGVVVVLKTAYDEAFSSVSPATLMRHRYFRSLFEAGTVKRIEFYGKVMEWHRRWTDDVRMLYHLNIYRTGLLRKVHERISRDADARQSVPSA